MSLNGSQKADSDGSFDDSDMSMLMSGSPIPATSPPPRLSPVAPAPAAAAAPVRASSPAAASPARASSPAAASLVSSPIAQGTFGRSPSFEQGLAVISPIAQAAARSSPVAQAAAGSSPVAQAVAGTSGAPISSPIGIRASGFRRGGAGRRNLFAIQPHSDPPTSNEELPEEEVDEGVRAYYQRTHKIPFQKRKHKPIREDDRLDHFEFAMSKTQLPQPRPPSPETNLDRNTLDRFTKKILLSKEPRIPPEAYSKLKEILGIYSQEEQFNNLKLWFLDNYVPLVLDHHVFNTGLRKAIANMFPHLVEDKYYAPKTLINLLELGINDLKAALDSVYIGMEEFNSVTFAQKINEHKERVVSMVGVLREQDRISAIRISELEDAVKRLEDENVLLQMRLNECESGAVGGTADAAQFMDRLKNDAANNRVLSHSLREELQEEHQLNERLKDELSECRTRIIETEENCMRDIALLSKQSNLFQNFEQSVVGMLVEELHKLPNDVTEQCNDVVKRWLETVKTVVLQSEEEMKQALLQVRQNDQSLAQLRDQLNEQNKVAADIKHQINLIREISSINNEDLIQHQEQVEAKKNRIFQMDEELIQLTQTIEDKKLQLQNLRANLGQLDYISQMPASSTAPYDIAQTSMLPISTMPEGGVLFEGEMIPQGTEYVTSTTNRFDIGSQINMKTNQTGSPLPYQQTTTIQGKSPDGERNFSTSPVTIHYQADTVLTSPRPSGSPPGTQGQMDVVVVPEEETSLNKSVIMYSPSKDESVIVNMDVSPQPLVSTSEGDRFSCDVTLSMMPTTPPISGGTPVRSPRLSKSPRTSGCLPGTEGQMELVIEQDEVANTSLNKSIIMYSPTKAEPVVVNIDVSPQPLVSTSEGDQFSCDVTLSMVPKAEPISPPIPEDTLAISPEADGSEKQNLRRQLFSVEADGSESQITVQALSPTRDPQSAGYQVFGTPKRFSTSVFGGLYDKSPVGKEFPILTRIKEEAVMPTELLTPQKKSVLDDSFGLLPSEAIETLDDSLTFLPTQPVKKEVTQPSAVTSSPLQKSIVLDDSFGILPDEELMKSDFYDDVFVTPRTSYAARGISPLRTSGILDSGILPAQTAALGVSPQRISGVRESGRLSPQAAALGLSPQRTAGVRDSGRVSPQAAALHPQRTSGVRRSGLRPPKKEAPREALQSAIADLAATRTGLQPRSSTADSASKVTADLDRMLQEARDRVYSVPSTSGAIDQSDITALDRILEAASSRPSTSRLAAEIISRLPPPPPRRSYRSIPGGPPGPGLAQPGFRQAAPAPIKVEPEFQQVSPVPIKAEPEIVQAAPVPIKAEPGSRLAAPRGRLAAPRGRLAAPGTRRSSRGARRSIPGYLVATPAARLAAIESGLVSPGGGILSPAVRLAAAGARLVAPGARLAAPVSRLAEPGARLAAPGSRLAAPGARLAAPIKTEPGLRQVAPTGRLAAPRGRLAEPKGRLPAPKGRLAAPSGRLPAPKGRLAAPSGRLAAPGARQAIPSPREEVPAPPQAAPEPRLVAPGTRLVAPGTRLVAPGTRLPKFGSGKGRFAPAAVQADLDELLRKARASVQSVSEVPSSPIRTSPIRTIPVGTSPLRTSLIKLSPRTSPVNVSESVPTLYRTPTPTKKTDLFPDDSFLNQSLSPPMFTGNAMMESDDEIQIISPPMDKGAFEEKMGRKFLSPSSAAQMASAFRDSRGFIMDADGNVRFSQIEPTTAPAEIKLSPRTPSPLRSAGFVGKLRRQVGPSPQETAAAAQSSYRFGTSPVKSTGFENEYDLDDSLGILYEESFHGSPVATSPISRSPFAASDDEVEYIPMTSSPTGRPELATFARSPRQELFSYGDESIEGIEAPFEVYDVDI